MSMMSAGTHGGALFVLPLAVAACASPQPTLPGDTVWSSGHFVYRTRAGDLSVCSGVLTTLERHFSVFQSYLGFDWPEGRTIEYFKFRTTEDFRSNEACTVGTNGCQRGNRVYAVDPLHEHELIHAYLAPVGLPPPILLEGVAQALSCSGFASQADADPPATWRVGDGAQAYKPGQWLVGHLLKTYGPEPFLDLYAAVPSNADANELAATFESVYAVPLDEVWEAATAAPTPESGCVFVWECAGDPVIWAETLALSDGCDQGDRYRTVAVDESSVLDFSVQPNSAYLRSCSGTPAAPFAERLEGLAINDRTLAELAPGSYLLNSDVMTELEVGKIPTAALSGDCSGSSRVAFEDFPVGRRLVVARSETPRHLRFQTEGEADVWVGRKGKPTRR